MNILQCAQIIAIVILWVIYIYGLFKVIRGRSANKWNIVLGFTIATLLLIYLTLKAYTIAPADWVQIMLTFGLVLATIQYAISSAKQAGASVKMAEEMKEQRRPIMVQQAMSEKDVLEETTSNYFYHFEAHNKGNSPAIEVEISLVDSDRKTSIDSHRQSFLGAGEPPIEFSPSNIFNLEESKTYYLVCEYKSILSSNQQRVIYQTWLPLKPSKSSKKDKIYLIPGELEFKEASEEECIDAFNRRSKPK